MQCEGQKNLASYTSLKEGPLTSFMCSIKKTLFSQKSEIKTRIKIMSSFYNIYCCGNAVFCS